MYGQLGSLNPVSEPRQAFSFSIKVVYEFYGGAVWNGGPPLAHGFPVGRE